MGWLKNDYELIPDFVTQSTKLTEHAAVHGLAVNDSRLKQAISKVFPEAEMLEYQQDQYPSVAFCALIMSTPTLHIALLMSASASASHQLLKEPLLKFFLGGMFFVPQGIGF